MTKFRVVIAVDDVYEYFVDAETRSEAIEKARSGDIEGKYKDTLSVDVLEAKPYKEA